MATIEYQNIELYLPLNEAKGEVTAHDYSLNRHDAALTGTAEFADGREGNAVHFPDGNGTAEIGADIINLSGNFTIICWIKDKRPIEQFTSGKTGLYINMPGAEATREVWATIPNRWAQWVIVKSGLNITAYMNELEIQSFELPTQPAGIAILQDFYGSENGYGSIDEIRVYREALTLEDIKEESAAARRIDYFINGRNLKEWDIFVSDSTGLLDRPKLKAPLKVKWDDYHGEVVDLANKRVEARDITLQCFMRASGKLDFASKLNDFMATFQEDGTQRLSVDLHPTKPLLYEIYNEEGIAVRKRWNDELMVGTFALQLREPDPVKRIIRHARSGAGTSSLTIELKSLKSLTISWGDGQYTDNVRGTVSLSHTYTEDGIYHAIISGNIEDIEEFTTNGIVVWEKL